MDNDTNFVGTYDTELPTGLPEEGPPLNDGDLVQRKQGWETALEQMFSNPHAAPILMTIGAKLLSGRKPGQTTGGVIGEAAMSGLAMDQQLKKHDLLKEESTRKTKVAEAQIAESGVRTAKASQDMEFDKSEQPLKMDKLKFEVDLSRRKSRVAEFELQLAEAEEARDPDKQKRIKERLDKEKAELNRIKAATASSYASAGESSERRRNLKGDNDAEDILANPKSTKEQKDAARERLQAGRMGGGGSRGSAQVEMLNAFKENYVKMNSDANEQQVAKAADEFVRKRNAGSRAAEIKGFVDSGIYTAKEGRAMLEEEGLLPGAGAAPAKGAGNKRLKFDSSGNIIR